MGLTAQEQIAPDPHLNVLVTTVDQMPEPVSQDAGYDGLGLTLTLSGLVISGKLIPAWQWHREVHGQVRRAAQRAGAGDEESDRGFALMFKTLAEVMVSDRDELQRVQDLVDQMPEEYRGEFEDEDFPGFIHLRDARVLDLSRANALPPEGMHWRGRLSEIAGWSVGVLHQTPTK